MSRYRFELADARHDAGLRRRMADDWMEGRVAVSFRREPSFFAASRLQGDRSQTLVCIDRQTEEVVALGSRTSSMAYVNGIATRIGYLADLRVHPGVRRGTLLARGYRKLRALHEADPLPFYTSVIYDGNTDALRTLRGARAGLPIYRERGRLLTPALRLDREWPAMGWPDIELSSGNPADLRAIVDFINACMRSRQFGPCYGVEDFAAGRLSGLTPHDFVIARREGSIAGTIALWDQSAMRQTHVERYRGALGVARPILNVLAGVRGAHPLPAPGTRIPSVYLACFAVRNGDERIGSALLREAMRRAFTGGWHYAICGLHERDPLAPLLKAYPAIAAAGRLFTVHYPEDAARVEMLDERVPRLEAGCL